MRECLDMISIFLNLPFLYSTERELCAGRKKTRISVTLPDQTTTLVLRAVKQHLDKVQTLLELLHCFTCIVFYHDTLPGVFRAHYPGILCPYPQEVTS